MAVTGELPMTIKTRDDYLNTLNKMRPNLYKFGELIEDVTSHHAKCVKG